MIITECNLASETITLGMPGEHAVTRVYNVKTDERTRAALVAEKLFTATPDPVPRMLTHIAYGAYVTNINVAPKQEGNASFFTVTVTAGKPPDGQDPDNPTTPTGEVDPLKKKVVVYAELMTISELITRDRDGKPFVNSAGQEFDEPIVEEREIPVITWERNYATYEEILEIQRDFERTHNDAEFLGYPAETAKFLSLTPQPPQYHGTVKYFPAIGRIAVKSDGWIKWIVDQGAQYYDKPKSQAGAKLINAMDQNGQLANGNVLLASDGTRLPNGQVGQGIGFYVLKNKDYAPLIADPT